MTTEAIRFPWPKERYPLPWGDATGWDGCNFATRGVRFVVDPEILLGGLVKSALSKSLSSGSGKAKHRSKGFAAGLLGNMSTTQKATIGLGLLAAAYVAYEKYRASQTGSVRPASPPPPSPQSSGAGVAPSYQGWTPPPPPVGSFAQPSSGNVAMPPPPPPTTLPLGSRSVSTAGLPPLPYTTTPVPGPPPELAPARVGAIHHPTRDEALLLLRAMIAAANADHEITVEERQTILRVFEGMGANSQDMAFIEREFAEPYSLQSIASQVRDPRMAEEVFTASLLAIQPDSEQEYRYLARLAERLQLAQETVHALYARVGERHPHA